MVIQLTNSKALLCAKHWWLSNKWNIIWSLHLCHFFLVEEKKPNNYLSQYKNITKLIAIMGATLYYRSQNTVWAWKLSSREGKVWKYLVIYNYLVAIEFVLLVHYQHASLSSILWRIKGQTCITFFFFLGSNIKWSKGCCFH